MSDSSARLFDAPRNGAGDYHAHIFTAGVAAVTNPRYVPDYDAGVEQYLTQLDAHGLHWGTLIQPSFLGTDNSLLLAALRTHPGRLRGVVVVDDDDPSRTCPAPEVWHELGIRGVRLNLIGGEAPNLNSVAWRSFLTDMAALGWHLEFQVRAAQLRELGDVITTLPCRVVIDHLGLPETKDFDSHPLSAQLENERLWVKASGAYRSELGLAQHFLAELLSRGFTRLVYGSDWPHTQFENSAASAWDWALRPELQPGP